MPDARYTSPCVAEARYEYKYYYIFARAARFLQGLPSTPNMIAQSHLQRGFGLLVASLCLFQLVDLHNWHLVSSQYKTLYPPAHRPGNHLSALVHIGPHKTSSTYIQSQICQNLAEFKTCNFSVPRCYPPVSCSYKQFAQLVYHLDPIGMHGLERFTMSAVSECHPRAFPGNTSTIISAEDFSRISGEAIKRLALMLQDYNVQVAYFYRAKAGHMQSYYLELQRRALRPKSSSQFILDYMSESSGVLSSKKVLQRWSEVFGETNVHVIHYNGVLESGLDTFETLVSTVAGLSIRAKNSTRVNDSPPHTDVARRVFVVQYIAEHMHKNVTLQCALSIGMSNMLANILPLSCIDYSSAVAALEQVDMSYMQSSGVNLHYFKTHHGNASSVMCDVAQPWNAHDNPAAVATLHVLCEKIIAACATNRV